MKIAYPPSHLNPPASSQPLHSTAAAATLGACLLSSCIIFPVFEEVCACDQFAHLHELFFEPGDTRQAHRERRHVRAAPPRTFYLTPDAVDSVVGIEDADTAPETSSMSADGLMQGTPESRALNVAVAAAPAIATPKRSSGLGAVKKSKAAAPSSLSAQRSPQPTPDHRVSSDSGDALAPTPHTLSEPPPAIADMHVADADHRKENPALSGDTEPAISLSTATTSAIVEIHHPHPVSSPCAVPDSPEVAVRLQTRADTRDAADINGDNSSAISDVVKISDKLTMRESQLEV